jgi:hypothetical protein
VDQIEIGICFKISKNDSRGKLLGFLLATNNLKCKDTFITYSKSLEESAEMDDGKMELIVASESIFNQLSPCWWLLKHASTYPSCLARFIILVIGDGDDYHGSVMQC